MRRAVTAGLLRAAAASAMLAAWAAPARAQLCHDLPDLEAHHHPAKHAHAARASAAAPAGEPAPEHGLGLALGLRTEVATAAIDRRPIDYQGASLRVDLHRGRFHLRAQGTWYRLRDSLDVTYGPGDLMLAAMWTAVQRPRWRAGLALPVGAPLGDHEAHLGMGHWMIMPGVFAAAQPSRSLSASAGVAYNRALSSGHHNHGIGPYVNPMTAEELSFAVRLGLRVAAPLQLIGESALAAPLDGDARATIGAGFVWQRGAMAVSVVTQTGALRAPFTARGVADLSYAF